MKLMFDVSLWAMMLAAILFMPAFIRQRTFESHLRMFLGNKDLLNQEQNKYRKAQIVKINFWEAMSAILRIIFAVSGVLIILSILIHRLAGG